MAHYVKLDGSLAKSKKKKDKEKESLTMRPSFFTAAQASAVVLTVIVLLATVGILIGFSLDSIIY